MVALDRMDAQLRTLHLTESQRMAQYVFDAVIASNVIVPGRREGEADQRIARIAEEEFGLRAGLMGGRFVRSGPNTVLGGGWPDRVIGADDVVVVDFEPLLRPYETGFARTVVLGNCPQRRRLVHDLTAVATAAQDMFRSAAAITGRELHSRIQALATAADRSLGSWHVGRMTGTVPGPRNEARPAQFICPDNNQPLRHTLDKGWRARWILEIRLIDEYHGTAGTHTELLGIN
ncbi:M24 family metallopeptidase [Streptomyces sp. NPDC089799]|uniref:M24 family metallopeptidase n=1 Tax=Streptomyces sp. NPDC089799 TaxID=3155066 RepID=UPI003412ED32